MALRTHMRGERAVDDVEEFADRIDGKLIHAVERNTAVAARKHIKSIHGGRQADDQRSAVLVEPLRYRDVLCNAAFFVNCSSQVSVVGEA